MGAIANNIPIDENKDTSWDSGAAIARVKEYAMNDGNIDFSKYRKAFMFVEDSGGDKQGDYKFPFADIIDGSPKAIFKAVVAIMAVLNGGRGGADISDTERQAVYTQVKKYYKRFGEEAPELKSIDHIEQRSVGQRIDAIFAIEPNTVKELGNGVFEAIITTSTIDRQGESIDTSGITINTYMQNPVVLYGHDYEGLPIGKTTKLTQFKNKMKAQFQLAVEEYPFAATVAALIKGGYLNATSIGGIVKRWSEDYKTIEEMEMLEFSVVPVPANHEALIASRSIKDITGKDVETIRAEFQSFSHKVFVDKLSGIPQDDVKDAIRVLESLVARLKDTAEQQSLHDAKSTTKRYVLKDAKAVAEQSQEVIKTIKFKLKG